MQFITHTEMIQIIMIDTVSNSTDKITRRKLLASALGAWVFLSAADVAAPLDLQSTSDTGKVSHSRRNMSHRIVNIYNFIRNSDSRIANSENILFDATEHQINLLNEHGLPATFALQYDALINPRYQHLLKSKLTDVSEIGAWWEIPQPLVEKAGLKWRGQWPWDWQANIGFSPGYEPEERKKLVDVYMADFKSIFGKYPATVGSWYIDEVTLAYMAEKYEIVASCNCKDQIGTDGYTLWGGYWNQAYYPSRLNAYMPAQTERGQIDIPIFRMLGSDPIYQYIEGTGGSTQGVITLETIYAPGGRSPDWVRWFFGQMIHEPCLAFAYAQAGQENSFGWNSMSEGLEFQIPYIAGLAKSGDVQVETLEQSGRWFRKNFRLTPATAVTALKDWRGKGRRSVWYESRFYRINLFWDGNDFFVRDLHMFNENLESPVHTRPLTTTYLECRTLPVMDGNLWSASDASNQMAGIRLVELKSEGMTQPLNMSGNPEVTTPDEKQMLIRFPMGNGGVFDILCSEDRVTFTMHKETDSPTPWAMDMSWNESRHTGITKVKSNAIHYSNSGGNYALKLAAGSSSRRTPGEPSLLLTPAHDRIVMEMKCSLTKR
jgi:hypothetical protein